MTREFDVVVFGATGFTGQFVVEEIAKLIKTKKVAPFKWAVAGRSIKKLKQVLKQASDATGHDVTHIDTLEVDIEVSETLHKMAQKATVVANCVGPYRFFGEQVVKACIAEGAHHVDISGEPQFLEKMQLLYHKEAEKKGVYVVGACGFDSIPTDMGVVFLKKKFNGDVNSIETYLGNDTEYEKPKSGAVIHYATWQSAIYGFSKASELVPLRKQLNPEPLPKPKFRIAPRSVLHYSDVVKGYCLPFMGSDKSVVQRTERYFYNETKKYPTQIKTYLHVGNLFASLALMIGATIFGLLAYTRVGRYLLETYPRVFSLGYVSHEGPSKENANVPFTVTLVAKGWSEKLSEPTDQHTDKPTKTMVAKVRGWNPGYGSTCTMLVQSALTIVNEKNLMPKKGGVYTTGSAFANTTLIDRLHNTGLTFNIE